MWAKRFSKIAVRAPRIIKPLTGEYGTQELHIDGSIDTDGYQIAFIIRSNANGYRWCRLRVWFESALQSSIVGFQITDSFALVNWRMNGHPAFSVYLFDERGASAAGSILQYDSANREFAKWYLPLIAEMRTETSIRHFILETIQKSLETKKS
jgi:hypothetical protein